MNSTPIAYRPDIDGLRGIAVISVVLFHAKLGLSGGFVGVDVFFVISGYLITAWILKACEAGTFSFREFWVRRIRRILPAAFAMHAVVLLVGYIVLLPSDFSDVGLSAIASNLFSSNVYFWQTSGYFGGQAELKPLLHTWSLAIEEQFYLFFPLALVMLLRRGRPLAVGSLVVITGVSFLACFWLTESMPLAAFFLLPTRGWELLVGSLLAFQADALLPSRFVREAVSGLCLVTLGLCFVFLNESVGFPGAWAAVPVVCTAALINFNGDTPTAASRLLSFRPLVFIGLISYSLYLWHWPVFVFAKQVAIGSGLTSSLCLVGLSLVLAAVSWRWIESPFRHRRLVKPNSAITLPTDSQRTFLPALAALATLLLVASSIVYTNGMPQRLNPQDLVVAEGTRFAAQHLSTTSTDFQLFDLPQLGVQGPTPTFLVWGDSHALAVAELLDATAREQGLTGCIAAHGGFAPVLDAWQPNLADDDRGKVLEWNRNVLRLVREHKFPHVILISAWQSYIADGSMAGADAQESSRATTVAIIRDNLRVTVDAIREAGAEVWIFAQPPLQRFDVARAYRRQELYAWAEAPPPGISRENHERDTSEIVEIFQSLASPQVRTVDPAAKFFDAQANTSLTADGEVLYLDSNHLSPLGAEVFYGEAVLGMFAAFAEERTEDL